MPNYLEAVPDRIAAVKGFALIRRIMATEPMKSRIVREQFPGPDCATEDDILAMSATPCSRSITGPARARWVTMRWRWWTTQFRVHGVEGVRVIDASIMPTVSAGNTNAPTIMIGEKGADLIKGRAAA